MVQDNIEKLIQHYLLAHYWVLIHGQRFSLTVGQSNPTLDNALPEGFSGLWVTPFNPGSQPLDQRSNQQRLNQLRKTLEQKKLLYWPAGSSDPQQHWPEEPGFLIADNSPRLQELMYTRYGQNALLQHSAGEPTQLLLLNPHWLGRFQHPAIVDSPGHHGIDLSLSSD